MCHNVKTSLSIWGPGGGGLCVGVGFNKQNWLILSHIYPLIYINLHVKYGSNRIRTFLLNPKYEEQNSFFEGSLHKIQG